MVKKTATRVNYTSNQKNEELKPLFARGETKPKCWRCEQEINEGDTVCSNCGRNL